MGKPFTKGESDAHRDIPYGSDHAIAFIKMRKIMPNSH